MLGTFHTVHAFPVVDHENITMGGSGQMLLVKSEAEIEEYVNSTFPEMLRSHVNPYDYLLARGYNATGMAVLSYLKSHKILGMLSIALSTYITNSLQDFCGEKIEPLSCYKFTYFSL